MPSTVFDSLIFRDWFGTEAMRSIFSDETFVANSIAVEVALAEVQGELGIIPATAASEIARRARPGDIDLQKLKQETDKVGYPIVGLVHQLADQCGEAGRYVHWGATTQDIMDTATVLQMKAGLDIVARDLEKIESSLEKMARTHRLTVMAGRTHLQHALPTTFGHKAAVWLSVVRRHRERLAQLRPRVLVGQFAGAAGTLASLGDRGLDVSDRLMEKLGLARPAMVWHVARDGVAEAIGFLALVTASLAKIATDIMLMMQTEVGEAFEPAEQGRGSSSTMPQKRNPVACEFIIAIAKIVRQHAGLMLDAVVADHERASGPWQVEWTAVPESFIATAGGLAQADFLLAGLVVVPERMRRNLGATGGLIVAEAVMMALAQHVGRNRAHELVAKAARAAADHDKPFLSELAKINEITAHIDKKSLERLVDPANYLGSGPAMIDRLLKGT
jgi:3-carboxy-cis,cis-muconate cycloisomerase